MKKFTGIARKTNFEFTDIDGVEHKLFVSQATIQDTDRMIGLQKPLIKEGSIDLFSFNITRIISLVKKQEDGDYYFSNSIDDFKAKNYPNEFIDGMVEEIDKLSPIVDKDMGEKKS